MKETSVYDVLKPPSLSQVVGYALSYLLNAYSVCFLQRSGGLHCCLEYFTIIKRLVSLPVHFRHALQHGQPIVVVLLSIIAAKYLRMK